MGWYGRGRYEYATTPTVESCRSLDSDRIKDFTRKTGRSGLIWWGEESDPTASLSVQSKGEYSIDDDTAPTHLRLQYTIKTPHPDEPSKIDYVVPLDHTPCNFGGFRSWFRCPGGINGERCDRRVRKLYLPTRHDYFLCRECYDLGYRSSRSSGNPIKEAELRYRRAFAKADKDNRRPHPNGEPYFPERPKGMHRDTFEELLDDVTEARREWDDRSYERLREIVDRIDSDAGAHELPRT